jgi:hypothetical protein
MNLLIIWWHPSSRYFFSWIFFFNHLAHPRNMSSITTSVPTHHKYIWNVMKFIFYRFEMLIKIPLSQNDAVSIYMIFSSIYFLFLFAIHFMKVKSSLSWNDVVHIMILFNHTSYIYSCVDVQCNVEL